jgi:hypothetical protein
LTIARHLSHIDAIVCAMYVDPNAGVENEATNQSWTRALALYDSLTGPGWEHIPEFREFVETVSRSTQAAGLTAVTSHDTLLVSPYTCYPDWFEGRHVRLRPLSDGAVQISRWSGQFASDRVEARTVPLPEALEKVLGLLAEL